MPRAVTLLVVILLIVFLWLVFGGTANAAQLLTKPKNNTPQAIFKSQTINLKHSRYVCRYGDNHNRRWHCQAKVWLLKEWKESYAKLHPVRNIRSYVRANHPCLAVIIEGDRRRGIVGENRAYDPTLDFGGGHGNVYQPYGIPQANPGTKMRSAGPDWRTNPFTQLKWMIGYTVGRYKSECGALAFKISHGWY